MEIPAIINMIHDRPGGADGRQGFLAPELTDNDRVNRVI